MTSNLSPEERRVIFTRHIDAIRFSDPKTTLDLSTLSFPAWRSTLIESFVENNRTKDPNALLPSRSRLERIIRDKSAIAADPGVILDVPEGYMGTPASYKNELKYEYVTEGDMLKHAPKGGDRNKVEWKLVVPGEEFWALFAETHLPGHIGRDKCFFSVGPIKYLSKKTIGNFILSCCSSCGGRKRGKRELPVEGDAIEGPAAKRRVGVSQIDESIPSPASAGVVGPGYVAAPRCQLASPSSALYASGPSNPGAGGSDFNGEAGQYYESLESPEDLELFGSRFDNLPDLATPTSDAISASSSAPTAALVSSSNTSFQESSLVDDMVASWRAFDKDFFYC
ncbi:uncharacterized protein EAE97_000563 [Botrytis byssoidea]|uniref:Uncharacterized protein n=1 Tax=Botrytis byssoidea TaxID=139641 RepID=A0A9P5M9U7_9HELO|nr:uncharacterized protein EAE97_000563 [Botrytis byssoidea]KAF7955304.1 hypothetical protein EAE97_000563 [Botrytis byssoidea]